MKSFTFTDEQIQFIKLVLNHQIDLVNKDVEYYGLKSDEHFNAEDYNLALHYNKRVFDSLEEKNKLYNLLLKLV